MGIEIQPVTADRWDDLVALFERRGPRGGAPVTSGCWCMAWRLPRAEFERNWGRGALRGAGNRAALATVVSEGRVPGLLAYVDGVPVGWVSVAPREAFPRLDHSRDTTPIDDVPVWSIVCFYIAHGHRKGGVGRALLEAAVAYAGEQGAEIVEGYPVQPGDRDPFTGFESMFLAAGFAVARRGGRRTIVRRQLRGLS